MTLRSSVSLIMDALNTVQQNIKIRHELRRSAIGLIVFDVVGLSAIERTEGKRTGTQIVMLLRRLIYSLQRDIRVQIIAVKSIGDDFSLFVKIPSVTGGLSPEHFLQEEALTMRRLLEKRLARHLKDGLQVQLYAGSAIIRQTNDRGFDASIYAAMKQANHDAKHLDLEVRVRTQEFQDIVENRLIQSFFQPIVSLTTGELFGVEALLRGPSESYFRAPDNLFAFAQQVDKLSELDILACETSIMTFGSAGYSSKLFLNVDSRTLMNTPGIHNQIMSVLERFSLRPHNIVLEITERAWVADFALFNQHLEPYRNAGFSVAVDDVGMGYSSLQAITELEPEYIKIDKSLTSHIDREMVKSIMLETLVDFAHKVNCSVIAEGIETEEELAKVIDLGIHYGQGYLIGKPMPRLSNENGFTLKIPEYAASDKPGPEENVTVGRLFRTVPTFNEDAKVSEVAQYFQKHESEHSLVIVSATRPIGLVMRDKLLGQLATQYGVPLYWHRSIRKLMDASPLVVETSMNLDVASRLSMERDPNKVYDSIIVTESGGLKGIITIQDILSTINTLQLERARGSNPLTGLPGNRSIKREIRRRLASGNGFSIIYADIDHFKWFNDRFGFHQGDEVIQLLSDVLVETCYDVHPHRQDFVGHIGGDDFIVLTDGDEPERLCATIIRLFDEKVVDYDKVRNASPGHDLMHPRVTDRNGNEVSADGITLSLSLLHCGKDLTSLKLEEITEQVAALKKTVKQRVGSTYIQRELEAN